MSVRLSGNFFHLLLAPIRKRRGDLSLDDILPYAKWPVPESSQPLADCARRVPWKLRQTLHHRAKDVVLRAMCECRALLRGHREEPVVTRTAKSRVSSATRFQLLCVSTARRPAAPNFRRLSSCRKKPAIASTMASTSVGSTTTPVSSSRTAERTPPESPATTGIPDAAASRNEIPNPSTLISLSMR